LHLFARLGGKTRQQHRRNSGHAQAVKAMWLRTGCRRSRGGDPYLQLLLNHAACQMVMHGAIVFLAQLRPYLVDARTLTGLGQLKCSLNDVGTTSHILSCSVKRTLAEEGGFAKKKGVL
jgi:hypothetical protein